MRDAAGTALAIYEGTSIKEHTIYGASRLGVYKRADRSSLYQITDHLGNVRAVTGRASNGTPMAVVASTDYYPFGMPMPGRNNGANSYRYAYQGQEKDPETGKEAFQLRLWDSRIGRWLTTDPKSVHHSPYLGMANNPINTIDPDGGAPWKPVTNDDGSTSYVAEAGDTDQTFADQYGVSLEQAQSLIGTNNIQAGITSVSGQSVFSMNPYGLAEQSEVLKLQLSSYMATDQRVIEQFAFGIQNSASKGNTAWKATQYFGDVYKQLQTPYDYRGSINIGGKKADINIYLQWYTSSGYLWKTKFHQSFFGNNLNGSPQANGSMFGKDRNITHSQIGFGYLINGKAVWQNSGSIQLTVHTKNASVFQKQLFTVRPDFLYTQNFTITNGTKN